MIAQQARHHKTATGGQPRLSVHAQNIWRISNSTCNLRCNQRGNIDIGNIYADAGLRAPRVLNRGMKAFTEGWAAARHHPFRMWHAA